DGKFFFQSPASYDEKAVAKAWNKDAVENIKEFASELQSVTFNREVLKQYIQDFAQNKSLGMGKIMMPLRLALVGELKGPDIPDIMEILGSEETIARIQNAVNNIQ